MTTTAIELDVDRARILARLAELNAKIGDLTAEAESLKAELRGLPAGDYAVGGAPAVRILPTRRFDAAAALATFPVDQRPAFVKVDIDAAALRKKLTPEQVEGFMVESGKPKVVLL